MNNIEHGTASLWTRGMLAVLVAQFLSAMADNALLFGALALLRSQHYADWVTPVLQEFFVTVTRPSFSCSAGASTEADK